MVTETKLLRIQWSSIGKWNDFLWYLSWNLSSKSAQWLSKLLAKCTMKNRKKLKCDLKRCEVLNKRWTYAMQLEYHILRFIMMLWCCDSNWRKGRCYRSSARSYSTLLFTLKPCHVSVIKRRAFSPLLSHAFKW